MLLQIKPTEHLSFNWIKWGPNPSWRWKHNSGQMIEGEPLVGTAGNTSLGAPGSKISGSMVAVEFTDIMYQIIAQETSQP